MKKLVKYVVSILLILPITIVEAQQKPIPEGFLPSAGSLGIGFSINPVSGIRANSQFKSKEFVGESIKAATAVPYEMFILAQEPMASVRLKYKVSEKLAVKGSVGFSGVYFKYREYVTDDVAKKNNPLSEDVVVDNINFNLSGGGASVGLEYTGGSRKLRFVCGASLLYSFGGAVVNFDYGNQITAMNQAPTNMDIAEDLNDAKAGINGDIAYARPIKRYNVGFEHGVGLMCDLGIEWFFAEKLSLGANVTFTPIMMAWQPQTYTVFEGYSQAQAAITEYNRLVSPGSRTLIYGTENIGAILSLHYYFK